MVFGGEELRMEEGAANRQQQRCQHLEVAAVVEEEDSLLQEFAGSSEEYYWVGYRYYSAVEGGGFPLKERRCTYY